MSPLSSFDHAHATATNGCDVSGPLYSKTTANEACVLFIFKHSLPIFVALCNSGYYFSFIDINGEVVRNN